MIDLDYVYCISGHGAACKTIYIRKTIYFAYAKLYVLYKIYTFAYAKI